jgi:hypothetical protein
MSRSLRATVPALVLLTLAGCTDAPLGITADDSLTAPAPEFLIGDSPLIILLDPATKTLNVGVEMTKGIVNTADHNDRFWLRTTTSFKVDDEDPVALQPCVDKPEPAKQEQIKGGSTVPVNVAVVIDDDTWTKLMAAADLGATITANVTVELLLIDGAGAEHVLDRVEQTSAVDPKNDP